ncbi:hypothetical protein GCM10025870_10360 [Agromyces marinus]|uniref:N-acetyltransferase domain-containing protein n=1 Tax=Agromyces marinus TaxID=1389020 RepID=A0ABM8GZQ1_9MICO|nr:GNAT family N-acetyltransferase [Agromyces marinus]BDZ53963.1 hypothetical protein GCM10025870_10360 [Agromyces marinus]
MSFEPRSLPVDAAARAALAAQGLEYRLIDPGDTAAVDAWVDADQRGFHHARPRPEAREFERRVLGERRAHGVYDSTIPEPAVPVATVSSWPAGLSVPGGRSVDGWAVSSVTVAPTHRRRGIARAMMEAELATASKAGAAVAMLTVTEATIYGRYGYAPAAKAATIQVDRRRARWSGPDAPGRVHFVEPAGLADLAPALWRRAVARTPARSTAGPRSAIGCSAWPNPTPIRRVRSAPSATTTSAASRRASRRSASRGAAPARLGRVRRARGGDG